MMLTSSSSLSARPNCVLRNNHCEPINALALHCSGRSSDRCFWRFSLLCFLVSSFAPPRSSPLRRPGTSIANPASTIAPRKRAHRIRRGRNGSQLFFQRRLLLCTKQMHKREDCPHGRRNPQTPKYWHSVRIVGNNPGNRREEHQNK